MRKSKKKINLKLINYSYILFQTHFTYFNYTMLILNKIKFYNLLTNLNYILFSFIFFHKTLLLKSIEFFFKLNIYIYFRILLYVNFSQIIIKTLTH